MSAISTFDIFKIGIGPSSSHTMGPWRAAQGFVASCQASGAFDRIERVQIDLFGSLAKTGHGHGTDIAIVLGLSSEDPETCDPAQVRSKAAAILAGGQIVLGGWRTVRFDAATDLLFHTDETLPFHPNGMRFTAWCRDGIECAETYYSIGGGFILQEGQAEDTSRTVVDMPYRFTSASELLEIAHEHGLSIAEIMRANEQAWRSPEAIRAGLERIWETMRDCVHRGCHTDGLLPGNLGVVRRAPAIHRKLYAGAEGLSIPDWLTVIGRCHAPFRDVLDWVCCFALAVNEENAAFGRVVTAPTNGAAGVVPAVLMYLKCFCDASISAIEDFLLTAAAIGMLFKEEATISAAMGGCQAEIGVSSAMAAAGLCHAFGGSTERVLMAAEIAMEHHLGMTCDPVGGLVQIPCIERNTMGAVKAITACQLALESDPAQAKVSLDTVIRTMWLTAKDMNTKYKETSEGGLALLIPVSLSEC